MRSIKNLDGYLVVVFPNDNSGAIAQWFEYNHLSIDEIIQSLRYIRNSNNLYLWGRYKIFLRSEGVTLCQASSVKPCYEGKFRKLARKSIR